MSDDPRPTIAAVFSAVADTYDRVGVEYFSVFGRQLVDDAHLRPGERLLDVGTGAGAVLWAAAEALGPSGSAVGIDLAPGMVERAQAEIDQQRLPGVRVQVMDAQQPDLPVASFDVVTASFVLFFLPDPVAALANWRALLRPGGRLAITTFAGDDPRFSWQQALFSPYAPPGVPRPQRSGPFGSTAAVHDLVMRGGFVAATSTVREHKVVFSGPEQWLRWSMSHGQRAFWDRMSAQEASRNRAEAQARLAAVTEPDGSIILRQGVRYTLATRPDRS